MTIKTVQLSEVASFVRGVTFDKSQQESVKNDFNVPLLRAGNIGRALDIKNDLIFVPRSIVGTEQLLRRGDIAICLSSGSPKVVGKSAPLLADWYGSVGAFCGIVRPSDVIHPEFLALWLRSPAFIDWRNEQARGANIQNLRFSELATLEITLPNIEEQHRIAINLNAQLAAIEDAREIALEQLKDIELLSVRLLAETFT